MAAPSQAPPSATNSIRVEIYDQSYNLRGIDAEHILKLAEYVDLKMRAVAEKTATVDSLRVAVLAALNIADEYQLLKKKYDSIAGALSARASSLSGMLDEVIDDRKVG